MVRSVVILMFFIFRTRIVRDRSLAHYRPINEPIQEHPVKVAVFTGWNIYEFGSLHIRVFQSFVLKAAENRAEN